MTDVFDTIYYQSIHMYILQLNRCSFVQSLCTTFYLHRNSKHQMNTVKIFKSICKSYTSDMVSPRNLTVLEISFVFFGDCGIELRLLLEKHLSVQAPTVYQCFILTVENSRSGQFRSMSLQVQQCSQNTMNSPPSGFRAFQTLCLLVTTTLFKRLVLLGSDCLIHVWKNGKPS